ncbi:flavodoxin family protein [uncultured Microbacterium sp.]|uniref:flavodoxin family protein n=1 Tax=uncultured Microbacterium sp. TaxID=191216 RepID=UPI0028D126C4|nr:flavodoxin family protein [uncultured Microbacterium sp.]
MMRILGVTAGASDRGSADILLKAALQAAKGAGADVEMVRIDDLDLSVGAGAQSDDAQWFWDRLMESDGLIVSSPIYSRTLPGKLRLLGDKISGPQADFAFTEEILKLRAEGRPLAVDFPVDERVLRPRVAGFMTVGGSLPEHWKSLALPLMHTITASMQAAVVDQVQFAGAGSPGSIVLDGEALERAARLGSTVAEQAGRSYDAAQYAGAEGLCPQCHLSVFEILPSHVVCATCGARGDLVLAGGRVEVKFSTAGLSQSVLTIEEKRAHFAEVQSTAARHSELAELIADGVARYDDLDWRTCPPRHVDGARSDGVHQHRTPSDRRS